MTVPFACAEADKSINRIFISHQTEYELRTFLSEVCDENSTVPTVIAGVEEDIVHIHWLSGPMTIEVEVGPTGPLYLWALDEDGKVVCVEEHFQEITTQVKRLVAQMAKRVARVNPDWRDQYLSTKLLP